MARWAFVGMAAVLAADSASAQNLWPNGAKTAAPAAGTATTEKRIVTMRTAGQPERRVEILRSEVLPDGTQFTELKDITTGAVYSIMGPPPGPDPFPVSKTPAATEAKTVQVADAGLPQARPRPNDPLLGVQSPAGQPSTAVAAAARVGQGNVALPKPNKPEVALVNGGMPTTQPIPKSAAAMPKQSAFAKAVFGEWPQADRTGERQYGHRTNDTGACQSTSPARADCRGDSPARRNADVAQHGRSVGLQPGPGESRRGAGDRKAGRSGIETGGDAELTGEVCRTSCGPGADASLGHG
jgi:hypothetical protein